MLVLLAAARLLAADGATAVMVDAPAAAAAAPPESPSPSSTPAPHGLERWLDPATAPFIPIPEIDVDPHSGLTLGVIPTWLRTSANGEIERITAPDVIHNQYFGWGSRMRVFAYPGADAQWSLVGGAKQRVEREFDGRYLSGQTRTGPLSWSIVAVYDRSGSPRFFGIGNNSPAADETSYINNQGFVEVQVGRNFNPRLQLAYVARWRAVEVLPFSLNGLPSIETVFPQLPGLGSEHELRQGALLSYDTRDSPVIPHGGARYVAYGGFVSRGLGSSVSYSYWGADGRYYWAIAPEATLAWHAGARYMPAASEAPFWALSSLGGDRSVINEREPLRGVGADRFIDRNMFASGIELRLGVASFSSFRTRVSLELTPFLDAGKVFAAAGENPLSHLHTAPGVAVRAVASPFVVGYLDVGFDYGKPAVFSGINYPF